MLVDLCSTKKFFLLFCQIYCEENCVSPAPTYRSTMVVLNAAASAEETRRINHAIHMVNDGFLLYGMKHVLEFKKMMEEKYIVSDCLLGQPQVENTLIPFRPASWYYKYYKVVL